jgi:hypothetical protein
MSTAQVRVPAPAKLQSSGLSLWMNRLMPALGAALFDDLIRLIGEYCLSRLSWSPVLRSKRAVIADANSDGFGRVLQWTENPPAGQTEAVNSSGALSAEPLSELAGGSSVFSWAVRVDEWRSSVTVCVASADATFAPEKCGICDKTFGVYVPGLLYPPVPMHAATRMPGADLWEAPTIPPPEKDARRQIRMTADLKANTVRVALESVPMGMADEGDGEGERGASTTNSPKQQRIEHPSWAYPVPDLSRRHLHMASGLTTRLTLRR